MVFPMELGSTKFRFEMLRVASFIVAVAISALAVSHSCTKDIDRTISEFD